eukprot:6685477-Pyramimonas_sp.AAC.1
MGRARLSTEKRPEKCPNAAKRVLGGQPSGATAKAFPSSERRRASTACWFELDMAKAEVQ